MYFSNVIKPNKEDKLQRWLTFLREDVKEEELKELMDMDNQIRKAEETIEYLSSDPGTIELYRAREDLLHERANLINGAKIEGIKEGKREGKIEGKVETARAAMLEGISIEVIKKITGLEIEMIEEIKKKIMM